MDAVEQFQGIRTDDGEIVRDLNRRNLRVEAFEVRTEGHASENALKRVSAVRAASLVSG
jgi:hypothetical protein